MLNTSLKSTDDISWHMDSVKQSPVKIGLVFLTNMINQWLPIKRNVKTPIAKNLEILSACACNEGSCARKKFFLFATQRFRNVPFRKWMSSFSDGLELCLTLLCHFRLRVAIIVLMRIFQWTNPSQGPLKILNIQVGTWLKWLKLGWKRSLNKNVSYFRVCDWITATNLIINGSTSKDRSFAARCFSFPLQFPSLFLLPLFQD